MKEAGFENIVVDLKPKTCNYGTVENFKGKFKNINQNQILLLNRTNFNKYLYKFPHLQKA